MDLSRRTVLKGGAGALSLGALAGCLSAPDGVEGEGGYAAFFTLWDWAEQVADGEIEFENPAEAGEMGHGWEPDGDLAADIAASKVFIYLDTPEFSWAQHVVSDLERDYEDDVIVIDGLEGMGPYLIPFGADAGSLPEPDYEHDFDPEEINQDRFDFYDLRSNDQLGYWHVEHWHGGVPDVPLEGSVPIGAVFRDHSERVVPIGPNEPFQFDARLADGAPEGVLDITSHGEYVELEGFETGETSIVFELRYEDELVYDTDEYPMDVEVVDDADDGGATEFHDPHVWVDPVLAGRVVDTIADGLADVDPDNADLFADNAAAYKERLDAVDEQFKQLAADADRDVAVFVGHDSYRYIERRYDFQLHTPVGVAPDAAESLEDISNMIDIVEEHDIETILYDPFEASGGDDLPNAATMLLENSSATNAEPLSAAEGTTREWADEGWGWVEQMEEVNLPSLRKALGAS